MTTLEENKAIVCGYMEEVFNNGALSAIPSFFVEGHVTFNGMHLTVSQVYGYWHQAFPDARIAIEDQIAERDLVVTRVTFHGTHEGRYKGIEPTHRGVTWTGIAIDRIVEGKVVEMWHEADELGLLKQLGAVPRPT